MVNMTLAMPDDVHAKMKQFPEISWSEVARQAIIKRLAREEEFQKLLAQAKEEEVLPKDVQIIEQQIKKAISNRLRDAARR
jgi:hypothetical protein